VRQGFSRPDTTPVRCRDQARNRSGRAPLHRRRPTKDRRRRPLRCRFRPAASAPRGSRAHARDGLVGELVQHRFQFVMVRRSPFSRLGAGARQERLLPNIHILGAKYSEQIAHRSVFPEAALLASCIKAASVLVMRPNCVSPSARRHRQILPCRRPPLAQRSEAARLKEQRGLPRWACGSTAVATGTAPRPQSARIG
jgi:hypothetical protein